MRVVLSTLRCLRGCFSISVVHTARRHTSAQAPLTWSYIHGASDMPLKGETIGQLLEKRTELTPDKEALVFCDGNIRLTFSQLLEKADKLAAGLTSLGVKRGDRVGVWGNNRVEWVIAQYATARAGVILVNINPKYIASDLAYSLEKVGCKVLIAAERLFSTSYYDILTEIIPNLGNTTGHVKSTRLPDLEHIIMMKDQWDSTSLPGTLRFDDVMHAGSPADVSYIRDLQQKLQFDDPINIQFTSGTTGFPKAATLTHHNIVNNCYFAGHRLGYHERETTIAVPVPLYHCFGMVVGSMQMVAHGAKCVFPSPNFDPRAALEAVSKERCTSLYGVPTMFIDMLACPTLPQCDMSHLYTGVMGGSPCPYDTMQAIIDKLNIGRVAVIYGSTETSPVSFQSLLTDSIEKRVSTVGHIHPHVEAKIVDDQGDTVPVNRGGELCVRGYLNMLQYWNDPTKTLEVMSTDRWYKSGDVGVMDEDGYVRIVGRKKDMIIVGGENIYPVELENVLLKHPKVLDVQVIGVSDSRLGEKICACVKSVVGQNVTEEEIIAYSKQHLAKFKRPHYVMFMMEFPLTATGKVQKYQLRKTAQETLPLTEVGH